MHGQECKNAVKAATLRVPCAKKGPGQCQCVIVICAHRCVLPFQRPHGSLAQDGASGFPDVVGGPLDIAGAD